MLLFFAAQVKESLFLGLVNVFTISAAGGLNILSDVAFICDLSTEKSIAFKAYPFDIIDVKYRYCSLSDEELNINAFCA